MAGGNMEKHFVAKAPTDPATEKSTRRSTVSQESSWDHTQNAIHVRSCSGINALSQDAETGTTRSQATAVSETTTNSTPARAILELDSPVPLP